MPSQSVSRCEQELDVYGRVGRGSLVARLPTEGALRWVVGFMIVLALHVGGGVYLLQSAREALEGVPDDAISVELMPDPSEQDSKPDDVAGPKVAEQANPTSDQTQADDPDPPAPDSAPPTETKPKPDTKPEVTAPPAPQAEAVLPPEKKPDVTPPDPKPVEDQPPEEKPKDTKVDNVERPTAPSQASSGSAALQSGGRRPSAAAKATWGGEIGVYLRRHRRYPQEARAKGWQGTARVRVTIDENGHVLGRELVASSGRPMLDDEALALMQRSDPLPKPPSGMPVPVTLTVPVNFNIR